MRNAALTIALLVNLTSAHAADNFRTSITIDGGCGGYDFHGRGPLLRTAAKGPGCITANIGEGQVITMADGKMALLVALYGRGIDEADMMQFQYPFSTGGLWYQYATTDGIHRRLITQGTYTVVGSNK
jgi:hypothetical protein